jgi:hypothetical protein
VNPTARSIEYLRERGFIVHRVEHWNQFARRRIDAFGFGDLLIAKPNWGCALVQVTTNAHLAEHEKKMLDTPNLLVWLQADQRVLLHGWAKKGPRGGRKTWELTEREIVIHRSRLESLHI